MIGVGGAIPLYDYHLSQYSLLDWINQVLADKGSTQVHSVSYGNDEIQQTSTAYMYSCNDQFMAAGAYGISILFASGDQGVWGRSGHNGHFNPDFPAASPYITAVGGTDFTTNDIGPETCCKDSGGGFSVTFPRPSYQDTAVSAYLKNNAGALPPSNYYNSSGRGYPDIAAEFGLNIPFCIVEGGRYVGVAGTSASCPVVASFIAQINNERLNAGKATMGFLNPFIYQTLASKPSSFTDITTGVNNGGSGDGFSAAAGWDPCTGVGTVNYGNLLAAALSV
jgi:tripeptidyl-peptidase-1